MTVKINRPLVFLWDEKRKSKTIVFKPLEKPKLDFEVRKITMYDGDEIVVQKYDSKSPMNESNLIFDCDRVSHSHATLSFKDDCFYILILYPPFETSTTRTAILGRPQAY